MPANPTGGLHHIAARKTTHGTPPAPDWEAILRLLPRERAARRLIIVVVGSERL